MASSIYSRALRKAAELIGGEDKLRRQLRVPAADLKKWLEDKAVPPAGIFLRVVDLIIEETPAPPGSEPPDPPAPRDACASDVPTTRY